jgi:hypothetical protein
LTTRAPKPKGKTNAQSNKQEGSARLSFRIFIDEKMRAKDPEAYQLNARWTKSLMTTLYGKQRFFKRAIKQSPGFMDKILEDLERAVQELPAKQRPTTAGDLSNLELPPDVAEIFYQMLKGCPREETTAAASANCASAATNFSAATGDIDEEDDSDNGDEGEEYLKEGYDSLLNYITLRQTTKVKVYLASRALLEAIFGQPAIAESIISARKTLYHALKNQSLTAQEASEQFKSMFQGYTSGKESDYLNFSVSLTNPASYE